MQGQVDTGIYQWYVRGNKIEIRNDTLRAEFLIVGGNRISGWYVNPTESHGSSCLDKRKRVIRRKDILNIKIR